MFGIFGLDDNGDNPKDMDGGRVAQRATNCGMAMLELVDDVINPLLKEHGLEGGLRIGVGLDTGQVVVTKIGLMNANEITPYGPPVNHAAKFCGGSHEIIVSRRVRGIYPPGKGGQVTFMPVRIPLKKYKGLNGFKVKYPKTLYMLKRDTAKSGRSLRGH